MLGMKKTGSDDCSLQVIPALKQIVTVLIPFSHKGSYDCGLRCCLPKCCCPRLVGLIFNPGNILRQLGFTFVLQNVVRLPLLLFSSTCQYLYFAFWNLALYLFSCNFFSLLLPCQVIFYDIWQ